MEGKGPIYMRTEEAIQKIADAVQGRPEGRQEEDEGAGVRGLGRLPRHDHLAGHPVGRAPTSQPEEKPSEIAAAEPYFIGSHSGASGAWVSGPEDLQTDETKAEYFWGYAQHDHREGPVLRGRRLGRLQPQVLLRLARRGAHRGQGGGEVHRREHRPSRRWTRRRSRRLKAEILKPLDIYEQYKGATTDPEINPNYIKPRMFMFRLQKIMDEYAGGVTAQFTTSERAARSGRWSCWPS